MRTMLMAASYGVRAGVLDLQPHRQHLRRVGDPLFENIEDYLSRELDEEVVVAPYTSPPRANRKPVLHVLTPAGRTLGFAKVGRNELTIGSC